MMAHGLFWLKVVHEYFPRNKKHIIDIGRNLWTIIEEEVPLKINIVNWPANSKSLSYFAWSDSLQATGSVEILQQEAGKTQAPSIQKERRKVNIVVPEFYITKTYTLQDDLVRCHQKHAVMSASRHNGEHRSDKQGVLGMILEVPMQAEECRQRVVSEDGEYRRATTLSLDVVIAELEKQLLETRSDIAAQQVSLLASVRRHCARPDGDIVIDGLEYLTVDNCQQPAGSRTSKDSVILSRNRNGHRISSRLTDLGGSIRSFFPTQDEENFLRFLEERQVCKPAGDSFHKSSGYRKENLFLRSFKASTGRSRFEQGIEIAENRSNQDAFTCQVCNTLDSTDENPILFCSMCSITVHVLCYRVTSVPALSEEWVCMLCKTFQEAGKYMSCGLCTRRGGALYPSNIKVSDFNELNRTLPRASQPGGRGNFESKPSSGAECITRPLIGSDSVQQSIIRDQKTNPEWYSKLVYNYNLEYQEYTKIELKQAPASPPFIWVHFTCGFWVPGVNFNFDNNTITDLDKIDCRRFRMRCNICGQSRNFLNLRKWSLCSMLWA
jgi:PHD-finger